MTEVDPVEVATQLRILADKELGRIDSKGMRASIHNPKYDKVAVMYDVANILDRRECG